MAHDALRPNARQCEAKNARVLNPTALPYPRRSLAARWNMPLELATDLASLALYDVIIYADDSGSMIFEEGGDRINDLKLILARVAEVTLQP